MKKLLLTMVLGLSILRVLSPSPLSAETSVEDEDDPYVFFSDVEDPATLDDIKDYITAEDDVDGDVTDDIEIVKDNYSGNEDDPGDYIVSYEVTDSENQTSTLNLEVRVLDVTPSEIEVTDKSSLEFDVGSTYTHDQLEVVASDSYDDEVSTDDLTFEGEVDTDSPGTYEVIATVEDETGNKAEETLEIEVVDRNPPEIKAPDEIVKNANHIMSSDFFLEYVSADDKENGDLTDDIKIVDDELSGNADESGTYEIVLQVFDEAGNMDEHVIKVRVMEDIHPLVIVDDYHMVLSTNTELSNSDFVSILKKLDDIPESEYTFENTTDTYTRNADVEGEYEKSFRLTSSSGETFDRSLEIEVIESDTEVIEEDPGLLNQAFTFVKTYWIVGVVLVLVGVGIVKKNE